MNLRNLTNQTSCVDAPFLRRQRAEGTQSCLNACLIVVVCSVHRSLDAFIIPREGNQLFCVRRESNLRTDQNSRTNWRQIVYYVQAGGRSYMMYIVQAGDGSYIMYKLGTDRTSCTSWGQITHYVQVGDRSHFMYKLGIDHTLCTSWGQITFHAQVRDTSHTTYKLGTDHMSNTNRGQITHDVQAETDYT